MRCYQVVCDVSSPSYKAFEHSSFVVHRPRHALISGQLDFVWCWFHHLLIIVFCYYFCCFGIFIPQKICLLHILPLKMLGPPSCRCTNARSFDRQSTKTVTMMRCCRVAPYPRSLLVKTACAIALCSVHSIWLLCSRWGNIHWYLIESCSSRYVDCLLCLYLNIRTPMIASIEHFRKVLSYDCWFTRRHPNPDASMN